MAGALTCEKFCCNKRSNRPALDVPAEVRGLGLPERDQLAGGLRLVAVRTCVNQAIAPMSGLEVEGVAADDGFPAEIPSASIHFLEVMGEHFADLRHADLHAAVTQHVEKGGGFRTSLVGKVSASLGSGSGSQEGRNCLDDALSGLVSVGLARPSAVACSPGLGFRRLITHVLVGDCAP